MSTPTRTVVVTRPLAQALPLAERVHALGREAVVFPLLEIRPLEDDRQLRARLACLDDYALVAFVSPNAIDASLPLVPQWPAKVAIGVVGEGSRRALERYQLGAARVYCPSDPARSDSEALVETIDLSAMQGRRALIVRGESGREFLAEALRRAGMQVDHVAAYRRIAPRLDLAGQRQLLQLLEQGADWIVTSSEAMRILGDLVCQAGGGEAIARLRQQHFIVPHARIAEAAQALGCTDLTLTHSGDESLLAALQSRP
ncbi:MAG TPA: uroporphyrinogen-III synthase [Noviherbaspirillum sp.]